MAAPELMGLSFQWPATMDAVIGPIVQILVFGGWLLGLSLLLFMFPRFLAPPHMRTERGWIPEWWLQMGLNRDRRRQRRQKSLRRRRS